ncbi:dynein intermediate chain 3, ciliary [Phymastichus coffea]|uniref:dynein intermediate chain 3, ciliary n=1 Tax=Phymastichus coffea TaxID=108790 RepID=UPI00273C9B04|nr:dynein intermediate chain 3, ciliary [Phymastichus coffea]
METQFVYVKKRSEFGKRCYFDQQDKLEVDIKSDPTLASNYIRLDPVTRGTQCAKVIAAHEVNTTTATFRESGMFHVEGGWPKDINKDDGEQTVRYRRKIEKDELYIHTMLQILPPMEHTVLQNNACNIYEQYFDDTEAAQLVQRTYCRTVNVYRDPLAVKRPVTHVSWSPDQGARLAVSHCSTDFKRLANYSPISYIWDVENPNKPFAKLKPSCPLLALEYNSKDANVLASGLMSGQVAFWDVRRSYEPVDTSLMENSHRDPCDQVLWINSKTGTEFFSASRDGQIKWWDSRKLQSPLETLVMDLTRPEEQALERAVGVSALQFEPSIGTRFMCGLENGTVISGNRKGKTPTEKLAVRFKAQYGPVISVERNPTFVKNFLSVGDWTARIWSEDCRESCIMWTPGHGVLLTGGHWSPSRYSVFFLTKIDGTLDAWDLIVQQDGPVLSAKVCDEALTCVRPHEQGQLVALGSKNGSVYLLEFSESLTTNQKNDKALLTALLDRETRREKVIEAKNRELRLKMKTVRQDSSENLDASAKKRLHDLKDPLIAQCEQEYQALIDAELERQASLDSAEVNNNVYAP